MPVACRARHAEAAGGRRRRRNVRLLFVGTAADVAVRCRPCRSNRVGANARAVARTCGLAALRSYTLTSNKLRAVRGGGLASEQQPCCRSARCDGNAAKSARGCRGSMPSVCPCLAPHHMDTDPAVHTRDQGFRDV
eukprot:351903-Chlamydomonas_euryale.AAC.3